MEEHSCDITLRYQHEYAKHNQVRPDQNEHDGVFKIRDSGLCGQCGYYSNMNLLYYRSLMTPCRDDTHEIIVSYSVMFGDQVR